jgi:hypothetical protein
MPPATTSSPACAPLSRTPACRSPTAPTDSCVKPLTRRVLPSAGVAVSRDWINPRRSNSREGACAGAESFTSISCYKLPKLASSHRPAKPRRFGVQPKGCVPGRRGFRSSIRPATRSLGGRPSSCPRMCGCYTLVPNSHVCHGGPSPTGRRAKSAFWRPLAESPVEAGAFTVWLSKPGGSSRRAGAGHATVVDSEPSALGTVEGSACDPLDQRRLDGGVGACPGLTWAPAVGRTRGRCATRFGAALDEDFVARASHLH